MVMLFIKKSSSKDYIYPRPCNLPVMDFVWTTFCCVFIM